jgi:hypothetical protein
VGGLFRGYRNYRNQTCLSDMYVKLLMLLCFSSLFGGASSAQTIESNSNRERNFAFEVKQIDEFFERFNYEERSLIISYVKLNYPGITINRESLVQGLFNRQNRSWVKSDLDAFFQTVDDKSRPVYLDFYDQDWYAQTVCKFKYKGRPVDVVILMKIQQTGNGGAKWVIVNAYSPLFVPESSSLKLPEKEKGERFLNPMSHATNFISLSKALNDKPNILDYLDAGFLQSGGSRAFLKELLNNQLSYQYVKEIKYHFLQVDGWIFTVNYFQRQSINSGWLINRLEKATETDKDHFRRSLFHQK